MAKDHHLPATLLSELNDNLHNYKDAPWTAGLIKKVCYIKRFVILKGLLY
jgi:hypothetical protein